MTLDICGTHQLEWLQAMNSPLLLQSGGILSSHLGLLVVLKRVEQRAIGVIDKVNDWLTD